MKHEKYKELLELNVLGELTKDEEMAVMRLMKKRRWEQVNIRITREGRVMVSEEEH